MKFILFVLLGFYIVSQSYAQENPPMLNWYEINSEHARVIYPQELENQAQRVANLIDYLHDKQTKTMHADLSKLSVLLFNQTTTTNGYAALMPRHSGWYVTPSQSVNLIGSEDWFQTLVSHEYRHITQFDKSTQNFTKLLKFLLGDIGVALGMYSYPSWFFEGDAIMAETAFGAGGRGRMPSFEMPVRTMSLNGISHPYSLAKFGTYKTYYPNHYYLGWLLVAYGREHYGADVWDKTLTATSKFPLLPWSFSRGLRKTTGLNEKKFYNEAMTYYDSVWHSEQEKFHPTELKLLNDTALKKSYTRFSQATYLENGEILVKKSDMDEINHLVLIKNNGEETPLFDINTDYFSASKYRVVWATEVPDSRWALQSYSDLYCFDILTHTKKRLTFNQKYFAPALSRDATKIALVEYLPNMKSNLVIISSETGLVMNRFENTENYFLRTPRWSSDGKRLVYTATGAEGISLYILDIEAKTVSKLTEFEHRIIGNPMFYENSIVFNSDFEGRDNVYKIDIETKNVTRLITAKYGVFLTDVKDDKLLLQTYSASGYDIAEYDLNLFEDSIIEYLESDISKRAQVFQNQEQGYNIFQPDSVPSATFISRPYRHCRDVVKIHSWSLYSEFESDLGIQVMSDNYLKTASGIGYLGYDKNSKLPVGSLTARFSKYYPVFDISTGYIGRKGEYEIEDSSQTLFWNEKYANISVSIPLDLSREVYHRAFTAKTDFDFRHISNKPNIRNLNEFPANQWFTTTGLSVEFYNLKHRAVRDIAPKFGQYIYLGYRTLLPDSELSGNRFAAYSSIYFPGFGRNHSLNFRGGYEYQAGISNFAHNYSDVYIFPSIFEQARGHESLIFGRYLKLSTDYTFPLWYADFGKHNLLYFKQFKSRLFFDSEYGGRPVSNGYYIAPRFSTGIELFAELYIFGLNYPVEIGARMAYPLGIKDVKPIFELVGVSLPMY